MGFSSEACSRAIDRPLWTTPLNLPDFDPKWRVRVIIMDMDSPYASAENTPSSSLRPFTVPSSPTSSASASAESHSSLCNSFAPLFNSVCLQNSRCHQFIRRNKDQNTITAGQSAESGRPFAEQDDEQLTSASPAPPLCPTCPIRPGVGGDEKN